jgi:hypothetical protein
MDTLIIDSSNITKEIIKLLVEKYPDGYGYSDIINYKDPFGNYLKILQVDNWKTQFNVKIGAYLDELMEMFDFNEMEDDFFLEGFDF